MVSNTVMQKKRKSPIALSLLKNSRAAMLSAIEIHNKPTIKYRYEIVVLLILNSWELILKSYIYKYIKTIHLLDKNNISKPLEECLDIVINQLGKKYFPLRENLKILYKYRCEITHFYTEKLDIIIFGLLKQNIKFYNDFIKLHFNQDLSQDDDLVLLPLGFKKPLSPFDFISNNSTLNSSSKEVREFIRQIVDSTKFLANHSIDEPIIVDYSINLSNINRITNVDIIAGIDNTIKNSNIFTVNKISQKPLYVKQEQIDSFNIVNDTNNSNAIYIHQELSENLFDEINNVINANFLLSKKTGKFYLGESIYYRIYSDREHVFPKTETLSLLSNAVIDDFYAPFLYWLLKLPPNQVAKFLESWRERLKHPFAYGFFSVLFLLGDNAVLWGKNYLDSKFHKIQGPNYYYSFLDNINKKNNFDIRIKSLRMSYSTKLKLTGSNAIHTLDELLKNETILNAALTNECLSAFKGNKESMRTAKILDVLTYGIELNRKSDKIVEELS